ncbi:MAG: YkvA family protein [Acidimicrobiia bacterium]|nr:YkvA family protein [Acidimicrobiia bacterium]MDX2466948.1 YkvA family protein [Acidimicrobiia bacterium]
MDGEITPTPDQPDLEPSSSGELVPADTTLALVQHPLDTTDPLPMRTRQEILKEAVLLVPNLGKLMYRLLRDKRVPRNRRLAMTLVGAYVVSPIDLIPDFVPVLGSVDDLLVLAFAVDYLLAASPPEVIEDYWDGSQDGLELVRGIAAWGVEMLPDRVRRLVERR